MKKEILKRNVHNLHKTTHKYQKGVTLVSLIITVILMFILVGVVLNITIGENGLFKIAKQAVQKYTVEEIRERIEIEIANIIAKETALGNDITIEHVLQELLDNEAFESIDKKEHIGNIEEYEVKLKQNGDGSIVIEGVEKATGIRMTYTLNPKGYTNAEQVSILFKVQGKVNKVTKPDGLIVYPTKDCVALDYPVDKNGTYLFIVENTEGISIEKQVIVDTIDRLPPKDFEITATSTRTGININGATKDQEETTENTSSGIDHYEYFVKKSTDKKYTRYETKTVEVEGGVTYNIYVISYDKAGNRTQSNTITLEKITPPASNYGQGEKVNYTANGISDWEIFYKNEETNEIFIIASDYLLNRKLPSETQMSKVGTYRAQWPKTEPSYIEITDQVKNKYMMNLNTSISNENVKCMSRLLDTSIWNDFVINDLQEKGVTAIGGPTLEMWIASWNDWYPEDPLSCNTSNSYGYYLSTGTNSGTSEYISDTVMKKKEGYRNKMYYPYTGKNSDGCKGYWIVAPSAKYKYDLFGIECTGIIKYEEFYMEGLSIRPVICLNTNVDLTYNNVTGMWDIN